MSLLTPNAAAASQLIMSVTSPLDVSVLREVAGPAVAARRSAQLYPLCSARITAKTGVPSLLSVPLSVTCEVELLPTFRFR